MSAGPGINWTLSNPDRAGVAVTTGRKWGLKEIHWKISSRSQNTNCVEVGDSGSTVAMRDSKDRTGPVLIFNRERWLDFVAGAKDGEFDLN